MKTVAERIKALTENEQSPIRTEASLKAMSEAELAGIEKHVADKITAAAAAKKAADDKAAEDEAARLKAAGQKSDAEKEAEYLAAAPASIRLVVSQAKAQDVATREHIIGQLKTAQSVYTEAQLMAMSTQQLTDTIKLVTKKDYSGLGLPLVGASEDTQTSDVFSKPPDGYRIAIDKRNGVETKH